MPVLSSRKSIVSTEPQLLVENDLAPGTYRFELVVVDDSGNASKPATIDVVVQRRIVVPPIIRDPVIRPDLIRPVLTPTPVPVPDPEPIKPLRPVITPIIRPLRPK